jgi:hypothetical protein
MPTLLVGAAAQATRTDVVVVLIGVGLIALCFETGPLVRLRGRLTPRHLLIAAGLVGVVVVNPMKRTDWRATIAAAVKDQTQTAVVADDPSWRVWHCYLPKAAVSAWPGSCGSLLEQEASANEVIREGAARDCESPSHALAVDGKKAVLLRRR